MTRTYTRRPWSTLAKGKSFRVTYPPYGLLAYANSTHAPKVFTASKIPSGFKIVRAR